MDGNTIVTATITLTGYNAEMEKLLNQIKTLAQGNDIRCEMHVSEVR